MLNWGRGGYVVRVHLERFWGIFRIASDRMLELPLYVCVCVVVTAVVIVAAVIDVVVDDDDDDDFIGYDAVDANNVGLMLLFCYFVTHCFIIIIIFLSAFSMVQRAVFLPSPVEPFLSYFFIMFFVIMKTIYKKKT